MRIREGVSTSLVKGRKSELAAKAWFEAKGHVVIDLALECAMHDLEVSGLGRVQVKTCRIEKHGMPNRSPRLQCRLAGGNNGRRYPCNAFEWLCCVYWLKSGEPRFLMVKETKLRVKGKPYLAESYHCRLITAMTQWSGMQDSALWEVA